MEAPRPGEPEPLEEGDVTAADALDDRVEEGEEKLPNPPPAPGVSLSGLTVSPGGRRVVWNGTNSHFADAWSSWSGVWPKYAVVVTADGQKHTAKL